MRVPRTQVKAGSTCKGVRNDSNLPSGDVAPLLQGACDVLAGGNPSRAATSTRLGSCIISVFQLEYGVAHMGCDINLGECVGVPCLPKPHAAVDRGKSLLATPPLCKLTTLRDQLRWVQLKLLRKEP